MPDLGTVAIGVVPALAVAAGSAWIGWQSIKLRRKEDDRAERSLRRAEAEEDRQRARDERVAEAAEAATRAEAEAAGAAEAARAVQGDVVDIKGQVLTITSDLGQVKVSIDGMLEKMLLDATKAGEATGRAEEKADEAQRQEEP